DSEVEAFYEANKTQFEQPESRDVRLILNKDQNQVNAAKAALEKDDSPASWNKVAKQFSTDEASKDRGGLRQGVIKGQGDVTFDDQVFGAPAKQLVGPFKTQAGYYLIEVENVTPAQTTPLSQAASQIRQQLAQQKQQDVASDFQADFVDKWTQQTVCAPAYVID